MASSALATGLRCRHGPCASDRAIRSSLGGCLPEHVAREGISSSTPPWVSIRARGSRLCLSAKPTLSYRCRDKPAHSARCGPPPPRLRRRGHAHPRAASARRPGAPRTPRPGRPRLLCAPGADAVMACLLWLTDERGHERDGGGEERRGHRRGAVQQAALRAGARGHAPHGLVDSADRGPQGPGRRDRQERGAGRRQGRDAARPQPRASVRPQRAVLPA